MKMINVSDIQRAYNYLYECIRNYIWGIATVEKLADLEIAVYKTCPDIRDIQWKLSKLRSDTREMEMEDEDLQGAYDAMEELLSSSDIPFARLYQVQEVIDAD